MLLIAAGCAEMEVEPRSPLSRPLWTDIDAGDANDPMACSEYICDIMSHLREAEVKTVLIGHLNSRRPSQTSSVIEPRLL